MVYQKRDFVFLQEAEREPPNYIPFRRNTERTKRGSFCPICILGCAKELGQRLFSNIGLILPKLRVVVWLHSRRLTICTHSCARHISWAFCSAISGKQTIHQCLSGTGLLTANRWAKRPWNKHDTRMFTNSKVSAMEADNNSQLTQYQSNVWRKQPLRQFFWKSQYM